MHELSPEEIIRSIVAGAIAPNPLPPTKQFDVRYIRGLNSENEVAFAPQFLYLLDADLTAIAGVSLEYRLQGFGDPKFPDFSEFELVSVSGWSDDDIIFPAKAGTLLITVHSGIGPADVIAALKTLVVSVKQVTNELYVAQVIPFTEMMVATEIRLLSFVISVELDRIVRIIDGVRWLQTQVA
jgi:hypothetical protein